MGHCQGRREPLSVAREQALVDKGRRPVRVDGLPPWEAARSFPCGSDVSVPMPLMADPPHRFRNSTRHHSETRKGNYRPDDRDHRQINWHRLDWRKSDAVLARDLGVNKAHVNKARHDLNKPRAYHDKEEARRAFSDFLIKLKDKHGRRATGIPLPDLISMSGIDISSSAAYRVALNLKFRGMRQNTSRYDLFWGQVNWNLPESDLAEIWKVERGNFQTKRKTLVLRRTKGVPDKALWTRLQYHTHSSYRRAIEAEKQKAETFKGPKPS